MKTKLYLLVLFVLIGGLLLTACGGASAPTESYMQAPAAAQAPAMEAPAAAADIYAPQQAGGTTSDAAKQDPNSPAPAPQNASYATTGMIIKNAEIQLLVEDTDVAIDRSTQALADLGGYIISSRVWYQPYADGKNYKYSTITVGIPVTEFEHMLNRLRGLAVQVVDETATGEDVSNQYVDLQSQLTNLQSTRERIKAFLDQATTVDEALRVNQELSTIEGQIEEIQGRMNYLKDRSSFSTITITFSPQLPEIKPDPTPTPIPWNPGETFGHAAKTLTSAYQGIIELLIWFFIVLLPIVLPPVLILWGIWKLLSRKPKS